MKIIIGKKNKNYGVNEIFEKLSFTMELFFSLIHCKTREALLQQFILHHVIRKENFRWLFNTRESQ